MIYRHLPFKKLVSKAFSLILLSPCLLFMSVGNHALGQSILNSPLSYIGMGELYPVDAPSNTMMGGLGVSNSNGIYSNVINPALLARNHYTVFEASVNTELKNLQDYKQRQRVFGGNYQSLNLTLPITSRWTTQIGIRPHSAVDYETKSYRRLNLLGVDSLIYSYQGKGSVTKLSFSNGVRIGKDFYFGLEASYLFGNVTRDVSTQNMSDGQFYKIQLENATSYSDFAFKGGLAYRHSLKSDIFLNIGASFDLTSTLNANELKRFAIKDLSGINTINADTLEKKTSFKQNLPMTKTLGVSIEKVAKWMIGIDYSQTDWTSVVNNLGRSTKLPISSKIAIGGEITPDFSAISNYFKRVTYRFGISYTKTPYDYAGNGNYAIDQNISAGFALPLRNLSYLNIAYQVGRRGLLSDNGLEEQYQRITLGMTLSDLWFVKQRIN